MGRSPWPARTSGRPRARRAASALVVMAATATGLTACGARSRVASPGGQPIHVQQTSLGATLRTDRHNSITVTEYRSAVAAAGHERARHGMHLEAADLKICATTSGGVVGPSMATLRTSHNTHVSASGETPISPPLGSQRLAPRHCVRGWVAFEVPNTTTGARIVISDDNDDSMRWSIH